MKACFYHIKLNVSDPSFYKAFLAELGFKVTTEFDTGFGASDGKSSIWVFKTSENNQKDFNYQATGLNHLAFRVKSKSDVDTFYKNYLLKNGISILFKPAEHSNYNRGKGYYAVFFEDFDKIKLEVACVAE
jgi:hypothetical protein